MDLQIRLTKLDLEKSQMLEVCTDLNNSKSEILDGMWDCIG